MKWQKFQSRLSLLWQIEDHEIGRKFFKSSLSEVLDLSDKFLEMRFEFLEVGMHPKSPGTHHGSFIPINDPVAIVIMDPDPDDWF